MFLVTNELPPAAFAEPAPVFACRAAPAFRRGVSSADIVRSWQAWWGRASCPVAQAAKRPQGGGRRAELSLRAERQVEKQHSYGVREPPPPRAVRGAARHSRAGVGSIKVFLTRMARLACPAAPLFLEATQRNAVSTAIATLWPEPVGVKAHVLGSVVRNGRRPTEPAAADFTQCSKAFIKSRVAEARGPIPGGPSTAPTGRFTGHLGEKAIVEVHVAGIGTGFGR